MKKTVGIMLFVGLLFVGGAVQNGLCADLGMQASTRISPVSIEQGLIGLKVDMGSFAVTPRVGLGIADPENGDTVFVFTLGSGFDYYLSEEKLKPYVGGDFFIDFVDADDSDVSVTLNPHVGAEYWLDEKFSIGGNVGFQFGFGDFMGTDVRFGTTTMIHLTYYF